MKLNFKAQRSEGRRGEYNGALTGGVALFVHPDDAANFKYPAKLPQVVIDTLNEQLASTGEQLDAGEYDLLSVKKHTSGGSVGNYRIPTDWESMLAGAPVSDMEPR